jgi:hypothetical protein
MAALAAIRDTQKKDSALTTLRGLPAKAATKVWAGSLVVSDAGYAAPGRIATTLIAFGRARKTIDNTAGASGDLWVPVESGTFKWANSTAGDAIAQTDVGAQCYIVDDQTVAKTSNTNTRSVAGIIMGVDSDGVWVQTGPGTNTI